MKIEIESGIHTNSKTKDCKIPMGLNTTVKVDGKPVENISEIFFGVRVDEVARWYYGLRGEPFSLRQKIRRWWIRQRWRRI